MSEMLQRQFRRLLLLLLLLPPLVASGEPLQVVVSVLPQAGFVERIGGRHVSVSALVRPGYSPATYDPTPRQVAALAAADVYVRAGLPFENAWLARIRAVNPDVTVVDTRLVPSSGPADRHIHGPAGDPHTWTSPPLAQVMAARIRDALARLMPDRRAGLDAGYAALAAELQALDEEIRTMLEPLEDRRFLVYHPAWVHFADTYDLTQLAIEKDGKEPGARSLAALIEQAREARIKVVFTQPQFHSKTAQQVARRIGGRVEEVDPLAPQIGPALRRLAQLIVQDRT
jgi:zinc transport system substrate-binding protein